MIKITCTKFQQEKIAEALDDSIFCPCLALGLIDEDDESPCTKSCKACLIEDLIDWRIEE